MRFLAECWARGVEVERGSAREIALRQHFAHERMERVLSTQLIAAAAMGAKETPDVYRRYLAHVIPDFETRQKIKETIASKRLGDYRGQAFEIKPGPDGLLAVGLVPDNA